MNGNPRIEVKYPARLCSAAAEQSREKSAALCPKTEASPGVLSEILAHV
jgi:hypothetical protein